MSEEKQKEIEADENISTLLVYKPRANRIAVEISQMLNQW